MYISSFACYSKNNVFWTYQPLINEKYKRENSTTPSGLDEFRNTCGKKYDPATKQQSTNSSQYKFPVSETSLLQKRSQKRSNMEVILSCCCCLLLFGVDIELGTLWVTMTKFSWLSRPTLRCRHYCVVFMTCVSYRAVRCSGKQHLSCHVEMTSGHNAALSLCISTFCIGCLTK